MSDRVIHTGDGMVLPWRHWPAQDGAPRAVVLALHGFTDYSAAFQAPARDWTAHGISVYAYDQRGFGRTPSAGSWPGSETLIDDAGKALSDLTSRYPDRPVFVLGESMGGAIALVARRHGHLDEAAGLILVAPAIHGWGMLPGYQRASLATLTRLTPALPLPAAIMRRRASDNTAMLDAMDADPNVLQWVRTDMLAGLVTLMDRAWIAAPWVPDPALILYGANERLIPEASRKAFSDRLPATVQTRIYPRGYHALLRDLAADDPIADIRSWILDTQAY